MTAASNSEARKRATDHQPVAVLSIDGMPFVRCSCADEIKPQSSVWLQDHWQGSEASGIAALLTVAAWQATSDAELPLSQPIPAPVDSGAIGRLNEAENGIQPRRYSANEEFAATVACLLAGRMDGQQAVATLAAIHERIVREHTDRALDEERDRWIARLAHLCDDVWLRNRDRAMDLPDSKTHGWMRRGSSVWEQAANAVRSVLNDLADYDDEYVDRHASYMTWLRNGRDRDELRAARQEQGR